MASASQGSQSSKTTLVEKKTGSFTPMESASQGSQNSKTTPVAKKTGQLVINAEQSDEASKQVIEVSTEIVGNEDGNLPLEKKHTFLWSTLQSMEVFQKFPQNPHFWPLEQFDDCFREGRAIGCIVDFCSMVERSSRLQFLNEPKSSTDKLLENLLELEQNGFNVEVVRERIAMKKKLEKIREQLVEVEDETGKCIIEEAEIEESFIAMKEAKDQQIASLKLQKLGLEQEKADVERDFQTSAASLGITAGVNLHIGSMSTEPNMRNVGLKACSNIQWNNQGFSAEIASQEDSSAILEKVGDNLVSGKYESKNSSDFVFAAKDTVVHKDLDNEKNPIGQWSSSGAYGSVNRKIEGLLSQRKKSPECLRSLSLMNKYPKKEIFKSDPTNPKIIDLDGENGSPERGTMTQSVKSAEKIPKKDLRIPEIIHLESENVSPERLATVQSVEAEEEIANTHPGLSKDKSSIVLIDLETIQSPNAEDKCTPVNVASSEEKSSRPIPLIDLEEDEDQETKKILFALDATDLRESAGTLVKKDFEAQGYADHQEKSEGNNCHARQTEPCTVEGAILSDQGNFVDGSHCYASKTEVYKMEGAISSDKATLMDGSVRENFPTKSGASSHGVINASQVKKDKGGCNRADMKEEPNDKIQEAKKITRYDFGTFKWHRVSAEIKPGWKETKSSLDDVAYVSKVAKDKGVHDFPEDDANLEKESSEKIEKAREQTKAYDDEANEKGEFSGVEDDEEMKDDDAKSDSSNDDMDVWDEMSLLIKENWKEPLVVTPSVDHTGGSEGAEDCDHQFILKDDIGYVCRVCGLIEKRIDSIIEYQFVKKKGTGRTYKYERSRGNGSCSSTRMPVSDGMILGENFCEVPVHPRHRKLMKAHQFEGLKFLLSNVMGENPGGCVMAHAPGSGKTFMIISFLQVFMAKYPSARPLIVLPRGILSTWKKEFQKWQVEESMPLYDFYSSKAENRSQQLQVLRKWGNERSILFLSYKQFTVIVHDGEDSKTSEECRNFLVVSPSILILDEGHTTRNDDTETLLSLEKVKTPRKVVLSGTLYQNHVKEVFNVLNLVRPKFLKTEPASSIKRRIMSKVDLSGKRISLSDDHFYEAVERTILNSIELKRNIQIIQDLREMTSRILHYYKGDSLDELPGLVDFTVLLELSKRQKKDIEELKKCNSRFRILSEGSAIYVHPHLNSVLKQSGGNGKVDVEKIDLLLQNPSKMGAKARFYLNLLELCESTGEKLLVFSQYLGPLKFLERLTVKVKNYTVGREIFVITGDSNSDIRDSSMEQFNTSSSSRVFFGSIKACGEGISLVGASRIIILDIHLNPSVTRQAIGRAFRPGQVRKVYTYRLVAAGSPEEEDHRICFRKECIAKMWFDWDAYQGLKEFQMATVDVDNCGDIFLEMKSLNADVVSVCKRVSGKEAEKDAITLVPMLGDGTAEQVEQLQVLTKKSDKLDSLETGGHLEIKSGKEVHSKKGNLLGRCVLSEINSVKGPEKPGYSGSDGHIQMESAGGLEKPGYSESDGRLQMESGSKKPGYSGSGGQLQMESVEGSEKPGQSGSDGALQMESVEGSGEPDGPLQMESTEEVQKKKRGRPRKFLEGSEKLGHSGSGGQLQIKSAEEGPKRRRGRPRKIPVVEGSDYSESDGQFLMKTGEEVQKGKKRTDLESDAAYSLQGSHKRAKTEKDVHKELIGSRVKVWWPKDKQYYEGIVKSYDPVNKKHKVVYFDGDIENLILKNERWSRVDET